MTVPLTGTIKMNGDAVTCFAVTNFRKVVGNATVQLFPTSQRVTKVVVSAPTGSHTDGANTGVILVGMNETSNIDAGIAVVADNYTGVTIYIDDVSKLYATGFNAGDTLLVHCYGSQFDIEPDSSSSSSSSETLSSSSSSSESSAYQSSSSSATSASSPSSSSSQSSSSSSDSSASTASSDSSSDSSDSSSSSDSTAFQSSSSSSSDSSASTAFQSSSSSSDSSLSSESSSSSSSGD